ncbi:uncharacterized protein LOC133877810 [Alnus glutinosa]|uniref:uncharacterized protein LOC133877810 n=1 Tax=Alnus glutinosa TaxID=3517 RepID=UPI002D786133|nr:uncharacterized protein LOC133877810 [Alnus glutinosa]
MLCISPSPVIQKTQQKMEKQDLEAASRRLVIIGGGVAGSYLAKSFQFKADVTLIDPKEYFEIPWASMRAMVEPSIAKRSVINHREYFTNGQVITSSAVNVTETEVSTADGQLIPYDFLVIATGHSDPVPESKTERLNQYKAESQKINSAGSILIVGGGPTGVELAGEIAFDFPDKKVTLVHSGSRLLEFIGTKASDKTLHWLKSKKVEVKLEQRVNLDSVSDESKTYQTSAGEIINADCHFLCTGTPLGSAWLKETMLKNNIDTHGRLMVDENLRVKGQKNIFAIGDITDIPEIKEGFLAQKHADVAAKNLKLLMTGGNESKMATYKPSSAMAVVSLGRRDAVAQLPFATIIGRIPGWIKSGDLVVGRTRKQMGLEPHVVDD